MQTEEISTGDRDRRVARTLWVVLFCNLVVAAAKLGVSVVTGSLSVFADGIHALLDASSNVVGLVGIAVASRRPDAGHPYGHRRFETLAGVVIGLLILAGMVEVLRGLLEGLKGERPSPTVSWTTGGVIALTVVINGLISRYESRQGRRLRSTLLLADAGHTLSDGLGAMSVLGSFVAVALGVWWADLLAAAVVSVLIGRTAFVILRDNVAILTESARLDPYAVHRVAMGVPGVLGAHKVRSRGGPDSIHVDLHIHVAPDMTVQQAHAVTHAVADAVQRAFPGVVDVVIHTEPADGRERDLSTVAPMEHPTKRR